MAKGKLLMSWRLRSCDQKGRRARVYSLRYAHSNDSIPLPDTSQSFYHPNGAMKVIAKLPNAASGVFQIQTMIRMSQ